MPYLYFFFFEKSDKIWNCRLLQIVGGAFLGQELLTVALNNSHKIQLFIDQGDHGKRIQWTSGIDFTISVPQPLFW